MPQRPPVTQTDGRCRFRCYLSAVTSDQFDSAYHAPVMVAEVLGDLAGASTVLDGTLGGGGHSLALLEQRADVTGLDRDPGAIATATSSESCWHRSSSWAV